MWCVGQGANWVQTVAGVGGHPGPPCVWQPKNVQSPLGYVRQFAASWVQTVASVCGNAAA
jgi:hypothetical protein